MTAMETNRSKSSPVTVIVQARMTSTRLPGKVLLPLAGKPVLWHVVKRAAAADQIDTVVVATSREPSDEPIAVWCSENGVNCYRGPIDDVLERFHQAAAQFGAQHIVRITADCPLLDPSILNKLIEYYFQQPFNYCSLSGEFPDGLDCEVFTFEALQKARDYAKLPSEREHVTPYIYNHLAEFKIGHIAPFRGLAHHRWTLDRPEDYVFLQEVFDNLYPADPHFNSESVLALLKERPELAAINSHIIRNEGYARSLAEDLAFTNPS